MVLQEKQLWICLFWSRYPRTAKWQTWQVFIKTEKRGVDNYRCLTELRSMHALTTVLEGHSNQGHGGKWKIV